MLQQRPSTLLAGLLTTVAMLGSSAHAQPADLAALPDLQGQASQLHADASGTLHFVLKSKHWQLQGWPAALPRRLPSQSLQITSSRHPAGPVRRLQLSKHNATSPWLILMTGAPQGAQIMEGWRIHRIEQQGITLEDMHQTRTALAVGQSLRLADCQRLSLLAVDVPEENPAVASEREPRADWYLETEQRCRR